MTEWLTGTAARPYSAPAAAKPGRFRCEVQGCGQVFDGEWRDGKPWDAAIRGPDGRSMGGFEQGKQVKPKAAP